MTSKSKFNSLSVLLLFGMFTGAFSQTVPGAPTNVVATGGTNGVITVSWTAPTSNGGSPITSYTIVPRYDYTSGDSIIVFSSSPPFSNDYTVPVKDESYTFTITATNAVGMGAASAPSAAIFVPNVPGSPTGVTVAPGYESSGYNDSVVLTWTAPTSNGGDSITSYTATASPSGATCISDSGTPSITPGCTVTGLTNGKMYTFTVTATNKLGTSTASAASSSVLIKQTIPSAPLGVFGSSENHAVLVTWSTGPDIGPYPITYFTATSNPGGDTCIGVPYSVSCVVVGLTNGTSYTFTVTETNSIETSPASAPSTAVVPYTVPAAPTSVTAIGGTSGQITVSWVAPDSNGGSVIRGYNVSTVGDSGTSCTTTGALSCVVTGLTNTSAYTFTVVALNAAGSGAASAASAAVTGIRSFSLQSMGLQVDGSRVMFRLPELSGNAQVSIIDLFGRNMWSQTLGAGTQEVTWDGKVQGKTASSGLYILRLFVSGTGQGMKLAAQSKILISL